MQEPSEKRGKLFPLSELNKFSELNKTDPAQTLATIDTANEGSDYLCMLISKVYETSEGLKVYIDDVVFSQDNIDITEPICAMKIQEHKVDQTHVESNSGGAFFVNDLIKLCPNSYITGRFETSNKLSRIIFQSGFIKKHFYFRDNYEAGSDYMKFINQLTKFLKSGKNAHDDAPDCTALMAIIVRYLYGI